MIGSGKERLRKGHHQEKQKQQARGKHQVLFQFALLGGLLLYLLEKARIRKIDAGGFAEIEKVDDDGDRQRTERPKERGVLKNHWGKVKIKIASCYKPQASCLGQEFVTNRTGLDYRYKQHYL